MTLAVSAEEIFIALNKQLVVLDATSHKVTKSILLPPEILPKVDLNPIGPEASENPNPPANNEPIKSIQDIRVSPNGRFLAVTTTGRKLVLLYEILPTALTLLSVRRICRASSAINFSSDSTKILLCDKTGDCYLFDCVEHETPGKWVFGHLSMVLDVHFAPQQNLILTSDRDEKIRVTNYPDTHEIECFCLGHTEYISSINLLPTNPERVVVSVSGDNSVKLWDYRIGKKLHEFSLPAPGIKSVLRHIDELDSHLAVLVDQPDDSILIFKLEQSENEFKSSLIASFSFPGRNVTDLAFSRDVLYLTLSKDGCLELEAAEYVQEKYVLMDTRVLTNVITPFFEAERITDLLDVSEWFKKKYDNVSDYLERKKRRIDEKLSKTQSIQCS